MLGIFYIYVISCRGVTVYRWTSSAQLENVEMFDVRSFFFNMELLRATHLVTLPELYCMSQGGNSTETQDNNKPCTRVRHQNQSSLISVTSVQHQYCHHSMTYMNLTGGSWTVVHSPPRQPGWCPSFYKKYVIQTMPE